MAMVLSAFFAAFVAHPEKYGGRHVTDKHLAAFVHFWRVTGYYMGLKDRFNPAKPWPIPRLRGLIRQVGWHVILPSLLAMDLRHTTMARAVCDVAAINYPLAVYKTARG